jgi:DNA-binding transcriptional MerR regulator
MHASKKRVFTLEEISHIINTSIPLLKQWEKQFKAFFLFSAAMGKDSYTERDLGLFQEIKYLREEAKFTVEGTKKALKRLELLPIERQEMRKTMLELRAFLLQLDQKL